MATGKPVRVGIIGAGVSGIAVLYALKKAGFPAPAFESRSTFAGLWNSGYDSLHLFTSKTMASFPDYPMPDEYPLFPSRDQFRRYVCAFADDKGLSEHIQLNTEVTRVVAKEDGRDGWLVETDTG